MTTKKHLFYHNLRLSAPHTLMILPQLEDSFSSSNATQNIISTLFLFVFTYIHFFTTGPVVVSTSNPVNPK